MSHFGAEIASSNKFPGKLWRIVNNCSTGAIGWGQGGHTIIVHQAKFQQDYLDPPNCIFKTNNIGSFIRQLNLYGFRKLNALRYNETGAEVRDIHEFQNDFFLQGRPDLLSQLRRNVGIRRSREMAVKRRLEALQPHYTPKRQRIFEASGQFSNGVTVMNRQTSSLVGSSNSVTLQATQTGDWPVYIQWDGQAYKYVVMPETNAASTNSHAETQLPQKPDPSTMHVLHLPESESNTTQEYYLVSLTASEDDKELIPQPNQALAVGEYAELYQLADYLSSSGQDLHKAGIDSHSLHYHLKNESSDPMCSSGGGGDASSDPHLTGYDSWRPSLTLDSPPLSAPTEGPLPPIVDMNTQPFSASLGTDLLTDDVTTPTSCKAAFGYQAYVGEMDKSEMDVYIHGGQDMENKENIPLNLHTHSTIKSMS